MDEGDMFWKWPARQQRIETARRLVRGASPPAPRRAKATFDHADECPDAARFRNLVRSLVGAARYANLIDPLKVCIDGCTVRLVGSAVLRDCLQPYAPALGRAAVQVLGSDATCIFLAVPDRRAA
jgi:hypothetical protein